MENTNNTTDNKISDFINLFMTVVGTGNTSLIYQYILQLEKLVQTDRDFALAFVEPTNITKIHNALSASLGVTQKSFMIKVRMTNPMMRAHLMVRAIKVTVEKVMK